MSNGIVKVTRNEAPYPAFVQIDQWATQTDSDGIATFKGIPPGEARLTIWDLSGKVVLADRMVVISGDIFSISEEV